MRLRAAPQQRYGIRADLFETMLDGMEEHAAEMLVPKIMYFEPREQSGAPADISSLGRDMWVATLAKAMPIAVNSTWRDRSNMRRAAACSSGRRYLKLWA